MTFEEIQTNIIKGCYEAKGEELPAKLPVNHIQDENQSVKWNREYVEAYNKKRYEIQMRNRAAHKAADQLFTEHLILAIMDMSSVNKKQAHVIADHAYETGHAFGYSSVANAAYELCDCYNDILKAKDDGKPGNVLVREAPDS